MELEKNYRHELKYVISYADYLSLRSRLAPVMKSDPHTDASGKYHIRSIYFDNCDDKALREKINGNAKREKFRIRYYNDDLSHITLEKKMKINNLCLKYSAPLTLDECEKIIAGDIEWMSKSNSELIKELYAKMRYQQLRPRVRVSYLREPYIYKAGNVRVTFDSNVRTSLYQKDFFSKDITDISAQDDAKQIVLEVKYDAFLPEIIQDLIQVKDTRQQAFSKYGSCRRFG